MEFRGVYNIFGGQKGGSLEALRTPLAYGPVKYCEAISTSFGGFLRFHFSMHLFLFRKLFWTFVDLLDYLSP